MSSVLHDLEEQMAQLTAQREEQTAIIAEQRSTNEALGALYQDALLEIARLRSEYQPRSEWPQPAAPPELASIEPPAFRAVALAKIVELRMELTLAQRRADGAELRRVTAEAARDGLMGAHERCAFRERERDEARAALAKAEEENARLREEVETREAWHERLIERLCETLGIEDAEDIDGTVAAVVALRVEERDTAQAAHGRAHAALRDARGEITRMARDGAAGFSCAVVDEVDAILTDPTSAAAGEAHAATQALCERADEWLRNTDNNDSDQPLMDAVIAWRSAVAKVAARRGS